MRADSEFLSAPAATGQEFEPAHARRRARTV